MCALNALHSSARDVDSFTSTCDGPPRLAQEAIHSRIAERVSSFGVRPSLTCKEAFESTIKTKDIYAVLPHNLRPFDESKLKILRGRVHPAPLRDRLPPDSLRYLDNHRTLISRSQKEIDDLNEQGLLPQIRPYWDPVLRWNRSVRIRLSCRLAAMGLIGFRLSILARVALFFVGKKDGGLRMVVDGREPSALHRPPPHVNLGSAGAIAQLDLSDDMLGLCDLDWDSADFHAAGADLEDGFHQFTEEELASYFGLDFPEPAGVYGTEFIYDPASQSHVRVDPTTIVFPVYVGLPQGWSWSLYFCQSALASSISSALSTRLSQAPLLQEGRPQPRLSPHAAVGSSYVDNATVLGPGHDLTDTSLDLLLDELTRKGLRYHEVANATKIYSTVGVILDLHRGRDDHKPDRAWKLYLTLFSPVAYGGHYRFGVACCGWSLCQLLPAASSCAVRAGFGVRVHSGASLQFRLL